MNIKKHYRTACGGCAVALLGLSLRHLAHGVEQVTGSSPTESVLMAIGIDCAMVAVELATLAGVNTTWTQGLLIATCVLSAGFNVLGFLEHSQGVLGQIMAVGLGVFVPAAVYGLTDTLTRQPVKVKANVQAQVTKLRRAA